MSSARSAAGGFSSVELLLALLLTLLVVGAAVGLADPHALIARVQPDAVDAQQRLRVAADVLSRALYLAGAGVDTGTLAGPLGGYLPPVLPRRVGRTQNDPANAARPDAMTLLHVAGSVSQSALDGPLIASTASLLALPSCPFGRPACGLDPGDGLVIFDEEGRFGLFTVTAAAGMTATLRLRGQQGTYPFPAGSHAAEADQRVFYFDAGQQQLRMTDGDQTDQPVVDGISRLLIEYFGSPLPPRRPRPPLGTANCLFDAAGVPSPQLGPLPAGPDGLAPLPLTILSDGPWCGTGDTMYDADTLRIRRVRVTVTAAAGRARDPSLTFDVSPRNLGDQP